ncbi:MAG: class I SAM-dependent methyltransferase [Candidatus Poribacteria bacterium]|nr:class I SAM-dependent methyltransferase [Candidatus Poribacteria bacterium]
MAKPNYGYYALGYYVAVFLITFAIGFLFLWIGYGAAREWAQTVGWIVTAYGATQPVGYALGVYILPENRLRRAARIAETLPLDTAERVLDMGAGRGVLSIQFAKRLARGRITAVDVWTATERARLSDYDHTAPVFDHSDAHTRRNAELEGVADKIDFLTTDVTNSGIRSDCADIVSAGYLLFHLHEGTLRHGDRGRRAALAEFHRVLKPGGTLVVFELAHEGLTNWLAWTPVGYLVSRFLTKRLTRRYWVELIEVAGFAIERQEYHRGNVIFIARKSGGASV